METFASGFAQGFVRARERSEDRAAEKENTMFKYKMDSLMQMKEKRQKKQVQEDEWGRQADDLGSQMGDPEFKSVALQELRNGVSYENLQKRISEGAYTQNDAYKVPTQTVKMPMAVSNPAPQGTSSTTNATAVTPAPESVKTGNPIKDLVQRGKAKAAARMDDKVNARIDEIDPSLRKISEDDELTSTVEASNSKYIFQPKNKIELGDYDEAIYKLEKAVEAKDPKKIAEYKLQVRVHEQAMTRKAAITARQEGKDAKVYYRLDENGNLGGQFAGVRGQDGTLYDINRPEAGSMGQVVEGQVVPMDEYQVKRLDSIRDKYGEKKAEYDISKQSFVSAVDTMNRIEDVFRMNPDAATGTASLSSLALNVGQELQAIGSIIGSTDAEIRGKIANGNLEGIEKLVANNAEAVNELYGKSINNGVVKDQATAALLYNSLKTSAAYQFALSNAGKGKLSNQDFENALAQIEGTGGMFGSNKRPDEVMKALDSMAKTGWTGLRGKQADLESDGAVAAWERDNNLKKGASGLRPERIEEYVRTMGLPVQQQDRIIRNISRYNGTYENGRVQAAVSADQPAIGQNAPAQPQEKYPEGTVIKNASGAKMVRRGGKWEKME